MASKIQRARRIGVIATGTVKAIFRTGRTWGAARTRVATARRPAPTVSTGAAVAAGVAEGAAHEAGGAGDGADSLPDPDLANKVRTEIFRDAEAPKGDVNVNAENGVVYLRGEVSSAEDVQRLATQAREIKGVREVVNLLHLPGEAAPTKETVTARR